MIEPFSNIEPLGLPIPPPWLLGFKLAGFVLHVVFMNLWLVGIPTALLLSRSKTMVAHQLFKWMPFFMAFGINAGIVPLLFWQALYPQFFYPATILQAWLWLLVIPLLMVGYFVVYLAAFGYCRGLAATVATLLLTWIGLTFSATMSFAVSPQSWGTVFLATAETGAVDGLFLNFGSESLIRFFLILGIAFGTLSSFLGLTAECSKRKSDYQAEARPLVAPLYFLGLCIFGIAGIIYSGGLRNELPDPLWLFAAGAMPAGFVAALSYHKRPTLNRAIALTLLQGVVIAINAMARQSVQNRMLERFTKSSSVPAREDWESLWLFVVVFIIVLASLGWLVRLVLRSGQADAGLTKVQSRSA